MDLTVIDLFTGAGGLTQGWEDAVHKNGHTTTITAAVELDRAAAASYRHNFGGDTQYVGSIENWLDEVATPRADVVLGGPPCQGFSTLGKRDLNDERNFLWMKYAETIRRARPQVFVLENVVPFLRSDQYRAFESLTAPGQRLHDYVLEPHILSAADYGAFQNRKRAVVIGRHRDLPEFGAPSATHAGAWQTVEEAFAGLAKGIDKTDLPDRVTSDGFKGVFLSHELHLTRNYTDISQKRFKEIPLRGNRHDIPDELLPPCWRGYTTGSSDVMGRLHADKPSVTIRTEFFKPEKGRYLHPTEDRAITHFEAIRLQGFPDDFEWVGSKTSIARQIGNAVPVQLARSVSDHVITRL